MSIKSDDLLTPNSYIEEVSEWVDKIYEITEEDYVHGGEHGFSNVPHEQLSNRTRYLRTNLDELTSFVNTLNDSFNSHVTKNLSDFSSLRASLTTLQRSLESLSSTVELNDSSDQEKFNNLLQRIYDLQESFDSMEYKYAASDRESGDALTVATQRVYATKMNLVGVDNSSTNQLKYNTSVTVDQSTVQATTFKGNLDGEAKTSKKLSNKVNLTLYGDISGTAKFDGSEDVKINASICATEGEVSAGTYGPIADLIVRPGDIFYVPQFTVSKTGLITKIANREMSLALDPDIVNKTINNDDTNEKILLIGTPNQGTRQRTYSNAAVFEREGKLYSQYNEVVDVKSEQSLVNKTINGVYIKEAAGREVDDAVNGTINSDKLVTSDSLARHTHNYAIGNNGRAEKVVLNNNSYKRGNLVTSAENDKIGIDTKVTVESGNISAESFTAKHISATETMHIPGGKIWIEEVEGQGVVGLTPELEAILAELNEVKRTIASLDTDTIHTGKMSKKQTCSVMQLLTYNGDSYWLADNRNEALCQNLALALAEPDLDKNVDVLTYGIFIMSTDEYDGCGCYVGQNGEIIFDIPQEENLIIKKVGYVAGNKLIFRPEDSDIDYVVSIKNKTFEYDVQGNVMPISAGNARARDVMWEMDVYGDFMPRKGDWNNDYWETDGDGNLVPVGTGFDTPNNITWSLDSQGNMMLDCDHEFAVDSMWETDEGFDVMLRESATSNEYWDTTSTSTSPVGEGIPIANNIAFSLDNNGNLTLSGNENTFNRDLVWETDENQDFAPRQSGTENAYWSSDSTSLAPKGEGQEIPDNISFSLDDDDNIAFTYQNEYGKDAVWESDEGFDLMARETVSNNAYWNTTESEMSPAGEGIPTADNIAFSLDSDNNLILSGNENTFNRDLVWETDENQDFAPRQNGTSNTYWTGDQTSIAPKGEGQPTRENAAWTTNADNSITPNTDEVIKDKVWETDEGFDLMATEGNNSNSVWESTENNEIRTKE